MVIVVGRDSRMIDVPVMQYFGLNGRANIVAKTEVCDGSRPK